MPDHHTLLELVKISEALRDALRVAYELARAGENGEPLREVNTPAAWRRIWLSGWRPWRARLDRRRQGSP